MLNDRPMTLKDPEYPWFDKFAKYVPKDYRESVRQAIDGGGIKVADSLPELGKQLGLDPERLKKAVQEWNDDRTHRSQPSVSVGRSACGDRSEAARRREAAPLALGCVRHDQAGAVHTPWLR